MTIFNIHRRHNFTSSWRKGICSTAGGIWTSANDTMCDWRGITSSVASRRSEFVCI